MRKLLKNNTETYIKIRSIGLRLSPGQEYEITKLEENNIIYDATLETYILDERIQVGWYPGSYYSDPYEGIVWLKTTFDNNTYVIDEDGTTVEEFTPAIITDTVSGKKSTSLFMDILTMMKEFYNAETNPIYEEGFQQLIGSGGRELAHLARTSTLESIHAKTGWHEKEVHAAAYRAPLNMLLYYGWINSFNSSVNGWSNENVAKDMAKYDIIIFGDGVENPAHGDYANTTTVIARIKELNPLVNIFGYVATPDAIGDFQTKVGQWNTLGVQGIFMDEAGYDYGVNRTDFNTRVTYVHGQTSANLCFVNAWNMDHIIGTADDTSYPNSTWNPTTLASALTSSDWYLLESSPINTTSYSGSGGYESKSDWLVRTNKANAHRYTYGINVASIGIINNDNANGQNLFDFGYISALMWAHNAHGSSDSLYGASSAAVKMWDRLDVSGIGNLLIDSPGIKVDGGDTDVYWRYLNFARLMLDFSSGAQLAKVYRNFSDVDKVVRKYSETVNVLGSISGSKTIDLNFGGIVTATIASSTTFTFANPAPTGMCCSFMLVLTNGSTNVTWPGAVKWPGGTAPTLVASGVDVLNFFTIDGGTTWRGSIIQADSK